MQSKMQSKVNFNKSIRDKERKILEYYKKLSNNDTKTIDINVLPKPRKRTKKQIPKKETELETDTKTQDTKKLTKTAKLPISEPTKSKVVEMD